MKSWEQVQEILVSFECIDKMKLVIVSPIVQEKLKSEAATKRIEPKVSDKEIDTKHVSKSTRL